MCKEFNLSSKEMNGFEVFQMACVFLVNFVLNSALVLSLSSTLHRQLWCLSLGFLKLWRIQNEKKEAVLPFRGKKTLLLIRTAFFSCFLLPYCDYEQSLLNKAWVPVRRKIKHLLLITTCLLNSKERYRQLKIYLRSYVACGNNVERNIFTLYHCTVS